MGYCKSMPGAVQPFRRLSQRNTPVPVDTPSQRRLVQRDYVIEYDDDLQGPLWAANVLGLKKLKGEAALVTEAIQFLAAAGVKPGDVQRARATGVDLFEAASAAIRGVATFDQQAALASDVVVAEVVQGRQPGGADGLGSSVEFRVIETLKGGLEPGSGFMLRQTAGAEMDVSTDLRPEAGERFLLLLSRDYYEQLVAEAGRSPIAGAYAHQPTLARDLSAPLLSVSQGCLDWRLGTHRRQRGRSFQPSGNPLAFTSMSGDCGKD